MLRAREPTCVSKPKAVRHAFGAEATLRMISPLMAQKWMGHARIETTQVYATLIGEEGPTLARIMWQGASAEFWQSAYIHTSVIASEQYSGS